MQYTAAGNIHYGGSPTMKFFIEHCSQKDIDVDILIKGLEHIGNLACKRVLCNWLGKY